MSLPAVCVVAASPKASWKALKGERFRQAEMARWRERVCKGERGGDEKENRRERQCLAQRGGDEWMSQWKMVRNKNREREKRRGQDSN